VRLVIDTNVVVSALLWGGLPYQLLQAAAAGEVELYSSPALLTELKEVLKRPHLATRVQHQSSSIDQVMDFYAELAVIVSPLNTPRVVPRDIDDDIVIAVAIAAHADLIVSGDKDLLSMGSPTTFLSFRCVWPSKESIAPDRAVVGPD
jgi:putative PIN family toxin of toxin-antitoxin system